MCFFLFCFKRGCGAETILNIVFKSCIVLNLEASIAYHLVETHAHIYKYFLHVIHVYKYIYICNIYYYFIWQAIFAGQYRIQTTLLFLFVRVPAAGLSLASFQASPRDSSGHLEDETLRLPRFDSKVPSRIQILPGVLEIEKKTF